MTAEPPTRLGHFLCGQHTLSSSGQICRSVTRKPGHESCANLDHPLRESAVPSEEIRPESSVNRRRDPAGPGKVEAEVHATSPRTGSGTRQDTAPGPLSQSLLPGWSRLRRAGSGTWTAIGVLPATVTLWLLSLRDVRLDQMADLGLLQVLPAFFWVALALLTLGFCIAAGDRRTTHGFFAAYVMVLIAIIHATPSLLYPELRYAWAWKHVAVIDAMVRHDGRVPIAGGFDIYNQWPGFFQLNALLLRATGLESPLGYAMWAQPLANVLLLGPLLLIYRSVTNDRRLVWGAVWIYYSCSWVAQDYFAPQAFAFLLFASVIALVLRQLPSSSPQSPDVARRGWPPARLALLLVIEAAIASSHQLTPVMLISALLLLSLPRRNRRVALPALTGALVLTLAWNASVARPYVSENLNNLISELTRPEANIWSGVSRLANAAPSQVMVAWIERGLTGGVLLLAAMAFALRSWTRRTPLPLLVLAPLVPVLVNAYGGEMVFRAYLFALPAAAFLAAALLLPPGGGLPAWMPAVYLLLLAMLGSLVFGYYSKEEENHFTTQEAAATRFATTKTPRGSLIISVTFAAPGLEMYYDRHENLQIVDQDLATRRLLVKDPLRGMEPLVAKAQGRPAYVLLNRAQRAAVYLNGDMPADFIRRLNSALSKAPNFTEVYRNQDAVVYRFDRRTGGKPG
ncbi:glycosyltransferase [Streptomyces scabichelini]|uniref:glycosyltransferase n=1 Tax=Streptomyces scabichelini TaxID=2711217 RepID=UPI0019D05230|nr:glycosyltransferase [Streptomyces scabichelini]